MHANTVERLWREHNDRALKRLRAQLGNIASDAAEDALSEAWLVLSRKPDGYLRDEGPQLNAWLVLVARRIATRPLRADAADALDHTTYGDTSGHVATDCDVPALAERRRKVRELMTVIREDTSTAGQRAQRQAILARMLGISYAELQDATGYSATKVNRATSEGRAMLRARGLDA